jgi:hypothetical protein
MIVGFADNNRMPTGSRELKVKLLKDAGKYFQNLSVGPQKWHILEGFAAHSSLKRGCHSRGGVRKKSG